MAKRGDSATLYLYVKKYIMKLIISGKYPANAQLPTEYQLMADLGVGRATVRAALAQLEHEGTIFKRQGVGTFVCERSKNYGLEPLISFSFMLKRIGLEETNELIEQGEVTVSGNELLNGWRKGTNVYRIKRIRKCDKTPLAIEDNYYSPEVYEKLTDDKFTSSLAHNLLSNMDTPIRQLDTKIVVRQPSPTECKELDIKYDEKVVELTRWMYVEEAESPVSYVNFVIPTHVLEFPFLG